MRVMKCLECHQELERLDNDHLLTCCGLTLQEYAIKRHLPLDFLVTQDQINRQDCLDDYPALKMPVGERSKACLAAFELAGLLYEEDQLSVIEGDIKRLELLLWHLQFLAELGFKFRQEYVYPKGSHRVLARNRLKVRTANLGALRNGNSLNMPDLLDSLASVIAFVGELHAGYLFLPVAKQHVAGKLMQKLQQQYQITMVSLEALSVPEGALLRSKTEQDSQRLLTLLESRMAQMPGCEERFYRDGPVATVVKELVFDSAHYITDHPGKCSNLHGGHYALKVKVKDRIDPATGFVVDYGYLKNVVKRLVVDRLDHQNLNYVGAELAWRSSTELLCIYIWERLIDYLPGLVELQIHETEQSYCCYRGPSLAVYQVEGQNHLLKHFKDPALGRSVLRQQLINDNVVSFKIVGQNK